MTLVKQGVRWGLEHVLPRRVVARYADAGDLHSRFLVASQSQPTTELAGLFEEIRAQGPLTRTRIGFMSLDHDVVREVLGSPDVRVGFPEGRRGALARVLRWAELDTMHPVRPPSLLAVEPPDHTRYRKLVTRVFTARAVEGMRERVQQVADELLDDLAAGRGNPVDLVDAYCSQLPVTVISEILGVPAEHRRLILELGSGAAASLDMGLSWRALREVESSLRQFDVWLDGHIERLRRNPGDDLMSQVVAEHDEGGGLTVRELKATAGLLLVAGFETTVNLLGNGIALLTDHPDQLALLLDGDATWANAVEEVLRIDPPVLVTARTTVRETMIAGQHVPAHRLISLVLAGANRDPGLFADPHTFDVTRPNARDHLAFSAGRHFCLGAALARMEGEIGLRSLFTRYPDLALAPGRRRRPNRVLRGFEALPTTLPAPSARPHADASA